MSNEKVIRQSQPVTESATISVDEYHQRSKHSLQKYARGPDGLDWDTQPDPFRRFDNCPRFALPLAAKNLIHGFNDIYHQPGMTPAVFNQTTLGTLFELSLALSAWKVHGTERWSMRVNPSSGNLHPTEAYVVFGGCNIIPAGVYHYNSYDHCLEQRCHLKSHSNELTTQPGASSFLIGLSSIHWRESWKYGERAWRYCQHDVGHAMAAMRYAAAVLGWQVQLLEHYSDQQIASLLGLNRKQNYTDAETETPDVLLLITTSGKAALPDAQTLIEIINKGEWKGQANRLSPDHPVKWDIINQISSTCEKPATAPQHWTPPDYPLLTQCDTHYDASSIIRQRRSAQAFDAQSVLPLSRFYRILDALLPRQNTPPFDAIPWQPRIHLVLFVHRVEGLKPGLYVLSRSAAGELLLKQNLRDTFDWSRPPICPESLPLFHLVSANSQKAARTVSCHQALAADGAFTMSMLAEYHNTVEHTPWQYKQLFWEAGLIGQAIYLEAEAADIRATGIGCFFDDAVHEILGITNNNLQVVYHFTVGTPVLDTRLISLPPYGHLKSGEKA